MSSKMSPVTSPITAAGFHLPAADLARLLSPALLVDRAAVRANIAAIVARCGDPRRWRPHLKTTKTAAVWRELVAAGVTKFKCATTREAALALRVLRESNVRDGDLLVAYPLVGPARERLAALAHEHAESRVSLLVEAAPDVDAIDRVLDLFVDVNPGMDRTGIGADAVPLIVAIARRAGARFRGVHFYDGHLHDIDYATRRAKAHAIYDRLMELLAALAAAGVTVREVITSGTPTLQPALDYGPFRVTSGPRHQVSAGTVVFHDQRSASECPELDLAPAAVVLARVVSWPGPTRITCDAGSKSIAAEAGDPAAIALDHPELIACRPSEEHLPFDVHHGPRPERGSMLHLFPRHICPTVNLAEECVLVERGRILEIVPVEARAHDLWLEGRRFGKEGAR